MAARKKKKKRKAAARAKKPVLNVVVGSKVKEAVKSHGVRCAGDLIPALNDKVLGMLADAVARCEANRRGTVRPQDL
jgi:hypothetical protein